MALGVDGWNGRGSGRLGLQMSSGNLHLFLFLHWDKRFPVPKTSRTEPVAFGSNQVVSEFKDHLRSMIQYLNQCAFRNKERPCRVYEGGTRVKKDKSRI